MLVSTQYAFNVSFHRTYMPTCLFASSYPCTSRLTTPSAANKSGSGGHATEGRDSAGGKAKAKKEFPEAPDVAIGMQDERGGRGG